MTSWLILGGARSGKSAHGEAIVSGCGGEPIYLATGAPGDEEMRQRIAEHRARRGSHWRTIEEQLDIAPIISEARPENALLVDCLTLWLANLIEARRDVGAAGEELAAAVRQSKASVVMVANEVGLGIVPGNPLARRFRDDAGRLNQQIAAVACNVDLVAAGLALPLKREGRPIHG